MTEVSKAPTGHAAIVREKPLMNMRQILLMNLGFFGIQYSFGMQQTAVNPIYTFSGPTRTTCRSSTWPVPSPAC